jgi:hypothetical protein
LPDGLSGIFSAKGLDNANHVELFREIRSGPQPDSNYEMILRAVTKLPAQAPGG